MRLWNQNRARESTFIALLQESAAEIEQLRAVLSLHHKWHQEIGEVYLVERGPAAELIPLDLSDAYTDSNLCERTVATLNPQEPAP